MISPIEEMAASPGKMPPPTRGTTVSILKTTGFYPGDAM
jgi:hypothetical protein